MRVIQSFQSTYWTRRRWAADGEQTDESVLTKYPLRKVLLAASVTSWMRFAPEVERVLYVDRDSYEVIKGWGWINLWDHVELIEFYQKLAGIKYYTASKPYTWSLQTEPYWSCDLDCFLLDSLPLEKPGEWYGHLYEQKLDPETLKKFYRDDGYILDSSAKFMRRQVCVNTGMLFCPKPEVGRIIGLALLELDRQLDSVQWDEVTRIYRQEAAYSNFLRDLEENLVDIEDGSFFYHKPDNRKDKIQVDIETIEEVAALLGYEPVEMANFLASCRKPKKNVLKSLL